MIMSHTVVFPDAVPPETPDSTKEQCRSNKNKAHETEAEASGNPDCCGNLPMRKTLL